MPHRLFRWDLTPNIILSVLALGVRVLVPAFLRDVALTSCYVRGYRQRATSDRSFFLGVP
jgi:hypothetical protein